VLLVHVTKVQVFIARCVEGPNHDHHYIGQWSKLLALALTVIDRASVDAQRLRVGEEEEEEEEEGADGGATIYDSWVRKRRRFLGATAVKGRTINIRGNASLRPRRNGFRVGVFI